MRLDGDLTDVELPADLLVQQSVEAGTKVSTNTIVHSMRTGYLL
jgi:hypothetical protein